MGERTGDPEADAARALQELQGEARGRALSEQVAKVRTDVALGEKFNLPGQDLLTEQALAGSGALDDQLGGQAPSGLVEMVSSKLGITPDELRARTSPSRIGDFKSLTSDALGGL